MAISGNPVITGGTLQRGLRNEFQNQWQNRYDGVIDRLGPVMELGIASTVYEELWGYYETAPYPQRRGFGEPVASKPFRGRTFTTTNVSWDMAVEWYKHDRLFDQLRGLELQARQAGNNFATLPERVFFQILTAGSDALLLESVPTAPDGSALFATTAGGSARFGVTGGNIISTSDASGVTTGEAIRTDFFQAITRMGQFQDTEGQPAIDPSFVDSGAFTLFFNVANWKTFAEGFIQAVSAQKFAGSGSTVDVATVASTTNVVLDTGLKVRLVPTQRLSDDDWYVALDNFEPRPIFEHVASPLDERFEDESNSDRARRYKLEGVFWETIRGYGLNLPLNLVKVDNS